MLNKYEYVIKTSDNVERVLANRFPSVCGLSFIDKISRLNGTVPCDIISHLHTVRMQRNRIAHNRADDFSWSSYHSSLKAVHRWLGVPIPCSPPARLPEVPVPRVSINRSGCRQVDSKRVLLAAGAGLAGIGLVSLLGKKK